jgi:hypothetical protein
VLRFSVDGRRAVVARAAFSRDGSRLAVTYRGKVTVFDRGSPETWTIPIATDGDGHFLARVGNQWRWMSQESSRVVTVPYR